MNNQWKSRRRWCRERRGAKWQPGGGNGTDWQSASFNPVRRIWRDAPHTALRTWATERRPRPANATSTRPDGILGPSVSAEFSEAKLSLRSSGGRPPSYRFAGIAGIAGFDSASSHTRAGKIAESVCSSKHQSVGVAMARTKPAKPAKPANWSTFHQVTLTKNLRDFECVSGVSLRHRVSSPDFTGSPM